MMPNATHVVHVITRRLIRITYNIFTSYNFYDTFVETRQISPVLEVHRIEQNIRTSRVC